MYKAKKSFRWLRAMSYYACSIQEGGKEDRHMSQDIFGIHHVTAITSDPQRNLDFYTGVLGLRLVKLTVNFDDPRSYHLYYGDELGHPGTILTFFAWLGVPKGRHGTGQVTVTSFSVPQASLDYWMERLIQQGVSYTGPTSRFDETLLSLQDPDGLALELVAHPQAQHRSPWKEGPVPAEHAIRGMHTVTLSEDGYERTAKLLTETFGFRPLSEENNVFRFEVGEGARGRMLMSAVRRSSGADWLRLERFITWLGERPLMSNNKRGARLWLASTSMSLR